jgi:hypothetical protein
MKNVMTIAPLMIFLLPAAALADTAVPAVSPVPTAAPQAAPARPPLVCKVIEETGSLIAKKKVCFTAAEWKQRAFNAGQWMDHQTLNSPLHGGG